MQVAACGDVVACERRVIPAEIDRSLQTQHVIETLSGSNTSELCTRNELYAGITHVLVWFRHTENSSMPKFSIH